MQRYVSSRICAITCHEFDVKVVVQTDESFTQHNPSTMPFDLDHICQRLPKALEIFFPIEVLPTPRGDMDEVRAELGFVMPLVLVTRS